MTRRIVSKVFGWPVTIFAALLSMSLWLGSAYAGKVMGQIFPVVGGTHITRMEVVDANSTRIWGNATKLRDCSFRSLEWHFGTPEANAFVDVIFEEKTKNRPDGTFAFGPWVVRLTPEEIKTKSYATVFHQCSPFWLTETRFYP